LAGVVPLDLVRARDPRALEAFFQYYFHRIYGLVFRLIGKRGEAEDLTQEVFLKVYRALHKLDPGRDPGPWLVAIACNVCRDYWRSTEYRMGRRSGALEESLVARRVPVDDGDPQIKLVQHEQEERVQSAIGRLPTAYRMAVILYDYQGLSHEEIAAITGVSHAAARKRYSRALSALAAILEGPS
jgi:RNA polymerase sigma-70 factor (ECF subfamily)